MQVRVPSQSKLYVSQSDVKGYFYALELPSSLKDFFCLPAVPEQALRDLGLSPAQLCDHEGWTFPRLKAVPMGWNWAMWVAQRVHQFLALQAAGLDGSRLLVEGQPCPDLSDGKAALIVYADNLNVIGTDREQVQQVKDRIVAHLRSTGFKVHEELDACTMYGGPITWIHD